MSRYFFHVSDGSEFVDLHGSEFADLDAARTEAIRFAGDLLKDAARHCWAGREWSMRVADPAGRTLFTLCFTATDAPARERYCLVG